jgi:DNA-binding PadR family transcriptional regulator
MAITFSELTDSVLILLYELKRNGKQNYYGLKSMMRILNYPYSYSDIYQLARYLETDGYVKTYIAIGDAFLEITTLGLINVEKRASTFKSYTEFVQNIKDKNLLEQIEPLNDETLKNARKDIVDKLKEINAKLHQQFGESADVYIDVTVLNSELTKLRPNKETILSIMHSLREYPSIKLELGQLSEMLDIDIYRR